MAVEEKEPIFTTVVLSGIVFEVVKLFEGDLIRSLTGFQSLNYRFFY